MAFVLSEEQTMLRDMAKQFFSEQVPVTNLRQLRDDGAKTALTAMFGSRLSNWALREF